MYESQLDREQGDKAFQYFLLAMDPEYNDVDHLFKKARKKLGALLPDEMYGFAPALMLGGSGSLASVEKVKAVEHLMLLSQLTILESHNFPEL
ncbi:T6SS immunity protein Tdi1 domain-containing protein [Pseudomonas sp.]|uniref:T6SS immunity protein Tdi1 domain-containing protein n=1 Tax=Pseudomonas sp. TaxID=306 RepID=UPI003CC62B44